MTCAACKERGQTWNGDPPKCAFRGGKPFSPDNWNCATVGMIRDIVYEGGVLPSEVDYQWCDDQKYATVNVSQIEELGALALWVTWYKSRGRTEEMWLLTSGEKPRRPTEAECLLIAQAIRLPDSAPEERK